MYYLEKSPIEDNDHDMYKNENPPLFTIDIYKNLGKNIVISILDIFEKNPYSRIPNSVYRNLDTMRKEVGWECARQDRFRGDPYTYKKARKFADHIYDQYFINFERKKIFNFEGNLATIK